MRLTELVSAHKNPHRLYDDARSMGGVSFDALSGCWIVTSHATTREVLADTQRFSSMLQADDERRPPNGRSVSFAQVAVQRQILFSDGPEQQLVQGVILREWPRIAPRLATGLRALAARLLRSANQKNRMDLVQDFALPYSLETICLVMGIPTDDQATQEQLARWSTTFGNVTSGYLQVRVEEISLLGRFFEDLLARRPVGGEDLIDAFLRERVFSQEQDLVINCMMTFTAGRLTTQKLLGDGVPLLMPAWGEWRQAIRSDPGITRRLCEELLRVVTPTRSLARRSTQDTHLSDDLGKAHRIRKGERIVLFLESANRDSKRFADPHSFRADRQPNPHIAFGHGPHRCPGASIARMEITAALEALFETFVDLRPDPLQPPSWDANPNLGGHQSFHCTFD